MNKALFHAKHRNDDGRCGNRLFIVLLCVYICRYYPVTFEICNSQRARAQGGTECVKADQDGLCPACLKSDPEETAWAVLNPFQLTSCAGFACLPLNVTVLI